jgi:asparagine synthase (glutamine-hydrolysing)
MGTMFASELKALIATGLLDARTDERALAGLLAFGSVQEPFTIVRDVRMLPPGVFVEIDESGRVTQEKRYWSFPLPDSSVRRLRLADVVAEGRARLEAAARRHLLSDVPVGVFLSSGLDSTSCARASAKRFRAQGCKPSPVSFPGDPNTTREHRPAQRLNGSRWCTTHAR